MWYTSNFLTNSWENVEVYSTQWISRELIIAAYSFWKISRKGRKIAKPQKFLPLKYLFRYYSKGVIIIQSGQEIPLKRSKNQLRKHTKAINGY